ncbi:hypothetical protein AZI86_09960 [Bdellovibrio bacteriovorus]|uniref:Uncharacterized protein n=1 Tax=Bdellovibrio bacteriovorus TaxID=959 RepID=A0A150WS79_BDEBC|nr:hypothetical protein [Bdellovibrio bacteriovorus]KYG67312.1 hypothetical protein AZI86_09960 [Bdellovibrio bacteriovorus]
MSKKKPKSSAAENLIESLMEDLKDINPEESYDGLPLDSDQDNRVENTSIKSNSLWDNLANDVDSNELDQSEFSGGAAESDSESEYETDDEPVASDYEMPEGFGSDLPASEMFMMPSVDEDERYDGPSADGGYQSNDDLADDSTKPIMGPGMSSAKGGEDKTVSIQQELNLTSSVGSSGMTDAEKTVAVDGFANARLGVRRSRPDVDVKVSVGNFRGGGQRGSANVMTSVDASLAQAENLKIAQQRILELEREVEHLRAENEELASAGEIIRSRTDELGVRITAVEKEKAEERESYQSEILILKGNLQYKENEVAKARIKVDELETRLKSDFKKIRVRERELENRLELLRAEKSALVRSKDEYILEQKRKIDQLSQELDNYRKKCLELNKTIEANQDQVKRTERALRLALTNLEAKEENLVPLKKAE